jgi:hypothetical protein
MSEKKTHVLRMGDVDNVHIQADLNGICKKFNSSISDILELVEKKTRKKSDIWYIRKKFNVLCSLSNEEMIFESHDAVYKMRKYILQKDYSFLLKKAETEELSDNYADDNDGEMFEKVRTIIINVWKNLDSEESDLVWIKLKNILNSVAKYKLMIKAYRENQKLA